MWQSRVFCCGGYISDIVKLVQLCAYGVGGNTTVGDAPACAVSLETQEWMNDCHTTFRFPGSGGGQSNSITVVTVPPARYQNYTDGCPGSVIVQYPDDYSAASTSSPSVVDCSPNTPGFRTYKFLCPGSITFP